MNYFNKEMSISRIYGSGLAAILILLIIFIFTGYDLWLYSSLVLIVLLMIWPSPFRYFGMVWFSFGEILGFVVGKFILTVIYIILVLPVGLLVRKKIRRNMQLSSFKNNSGSAFKIRNYEYSSGDFEKPF